MFSHFHHSMIATSWQHFFVLVALDVARCTFNAARRDNAFKTQRRITMTQFWVMRASNQCQFESCFFQLQ